MSLPCDVQKGRVAGGGQAFYSTQFTLTWAHDLSKGRKSMQSSLSDLPRKVTSLPGGQVNPTQNGGRLSFKIMALEMGQSRKQLRNWRFEGAFFNQA